MLINDHYWKLVLGMILVYFAALVVACTVVCVIRVLVKVVHLIWCKRKDTKEKE